MRERMNVCIAYINYLRWKMGNKIQWKALDIQGKGKCKVVNVQKGWRIVVEGEREHM